MDINILLKKNHIFKNRSHSSITRKFRFKIGTSGLFSLKTQRFELTYIRGFKKIMRKNILKGIQPLDLESYDFI